MALNPIISRQHLDLPFVLFPCTEFLVDIVHGHKKSPAKRRSFSSQVVDTTVDVPKYSLAAPLAVSPEMLGVQVAEERLADGQLEIRGFQRFFKLLLARRVWNGGSGGSHAEDF